MMKRTLSVLIAVTLACLGGCQTDQAADQSDGATHNNNNVAEQCGDGVAAGAEVCDGADLRATGCTDLALGYTGGQLACNADCDGWDTSACVDPGQTCEDFESSWPPATWNVFNNSPCPNTWAQDSAQALSTSHAASFAPHVSETCWGFLVFGPVTLGANPTLTFHSYGLNLGNADLEGSQVYYSTSSAGGDPYDGTFAVYQNFQSELQEGAWSAHNVDLAAGPESLASLSGVYLAFRYQGDADGHQLWLDDVCYR